MSARWVPWDFLRNALDFTARAGRLVAQDDLEHDEARDGELPFDRLVRLAGEQGITVLDYRQTPRSGRGKAHGTRKLAQVSALLWHQTASLVDLSQALGIPCHALILDDTIVLLHPLRAYVHHAGAANKFTIGIEIRCRAAGIEGDLRTLWRSKREINGYKKRGRFYPPRSAESLVREATDLQIVAANLLADYYVAEVARQAKIERVAARIVASMFHRNSAASRVSDPGSRIALLVGLAVALRHALEHGDPVVGSGKVTPTVWGGLVERVYNWRVRGY